MGLIWHLNFILGGHTFTILVVALWLDALDTYLMLLNCPWLHTTNIKQHWQCNTISFLHGEKKVHIVTEEWIPTPKDITPLFVEGVHMHDGLTDEEVDSFLEDHPKIVPIFDIVEAVSPSVSNPTEGERYIGREPIQN